MAFSTHTRRLSQSFNTSVFYASSASSSYVGESGMLMPHGESVFGCMSEGERDGIIGGWRSVFARDIIESKVVVVDADTTVEEACDKLLSEGIDCLVVVDNTTPSSVADRNGGRWTGLFDFSDVNAFLTLAATRHTLTPDVIKANERLDRIVEAAKAGRVPVRLVSNFSDKNPYVVLPNDASVISLLEVFARGAHRAFIQGPTPPYPSSQNPQLLGIVSDKRLLSWFSDYSSSSSSSSSSSPLDRILSKSLLELAFPLLNIHAAVVSTSSVATVLDAMRLMSEEGVSSVAVVDEESGILIGGVSVTDIGKIVVPSQSNQILGTPLKQFVTSIKLPDGSMDGVDKYPVYSVFPSSALVYTIEKLLATNAHRLFVTDESESVNPVLSSSSPGNLTGIISIVDILSLFAHLAKIADVDPRRMQRHRRASSASSHSSTISEREMFLRSRSNSRTSVRRSPSFGVMPVSSSPTFSGGSSPVTLPPKSPVVLPVPDIGSALGGSAYGLVGRRGSLNAALRARKRESA
ncbi:CBS-domain-containing protein [Macrolepiota fuliginosa MF-IS2]|uniref:CBS-domain-containing protein n=1 Tax=Macrolepiota fuliginosa MF-IS2 TaxID=1400762 RepID=A0A9P5XCE2_9AGAR|nr:CBS-domain-containing protein [Macrolepiota fuliginosa MF-IS2]